MLAECKAIKKWLVLPIEVSNKLFIIAAKRWRSECNTLLHKALSAPSFVYYRKQLVASPYSGHKHH